MRHFFLFLIVISVCVAFSTVTSAQSNETKLAAPANSNAQSFGKAVAVDGDMAVISAVDVPEIGFPSVGDVYVFQYNQTDWDFIQALTPSGSDNAGFGASVAISGNTIAVGAYGADTFTGAVHIFTQENNTWTHRAKITPDEATNGDNFGLSVALDGDVLAVGARGAGGTGAVYVYTGSGALWELDEKLTAADGQAGDQLGISVDVEGAIVVGGAAGSTSDREAAYVFERGSDGTWTQQKLAATPPVGDAVALSEGIIIAGSTGDSASAFAYGLENKWSVTPITADAISQSDEFGAAVALEGNEGVIAAPGDGPGAIYAMRVVPSQPKVIVLGVQSYPSDGLDGDRYGEAVAMSDAHLIVGAPEHNNGAGTAYAYSLPVVPLQIVTVSPGNATVTDPNTDLTLTFNQPVLAGTGNIHIQQAGQVVEQISAQSNRVSVDGDTVTIDPASLLTYGTPYFVLVDANAFTDVAGRPFAGLGD